MNFLNIISGIFSILHINAQHQTHFKDILFINYEFLSMCQCPTPLQPPNEKIATCRKLLQLLAACQFVVIILAIFANDFMNSIMYAVLIFILYVGWCQFNWCLILGFFLISAMNAIQMIILLIGGIEHSQLFSEKNIPMSIYIVVGSVYFPTAIFVSHYAYKHFKNLDNNANFMDIAPGGNGGAGGQNNANAAPYYRVQQRLDENRNTPDESTQREQNKKPDNVFKGQGVRIG